MVWVLILLGTLYVSYRFTRIKRSIRIAVYLSGVALALVTALVAFVLRLSEHFWPPVVVLFSIFVFGALASVLQDTRRSRMSPSVVPSPEEQPILTIAQELCNSLQITKRFNPLYITWTDQIYSDEVGFEDEFQKRNLLLPLSLKNKLGPEELRVMIAAYLVQQKIGPAKFAVSLLKLSPLMAYGVAFVFEIPAIVRIPYADLALFVGYAVIGTFSFKWLLADGKKQVLASDRTAAKIVGNELFLLVLKKIDDLKLHDMQRLSAKRDLRARIYSFFKPTLQERVDNLKRMKDHETRVESVKGR